jgi:hypothetical protein
MRAIVMGASAYMSEGIKRNWEFVDYKSILSGAWEVGGVGCGGGGGSG